MSSKQKLEPTWIGKDQRPRLEPHIFLGDPVCRCHAKRRVMGVTVGMYGNLQGIARKSLQEIEGLELTTLEASVANNRKASE